MAAVLEVAEVDVDPEQDVIVNDCDFLSAGQSYGMSNLVERLKEGKGVTVELDDGSLHTNWHSHIILATNHLCFLRLMDGDFQLLRDC